MPKKVAMAEKRNAASTPNPPDLKAVFEQYETSRRPLGSHCRQPGL